MLKLVCRIKEQIFLKEYSRQQYSEYIKPTSITVYFTENQISKQ